MRLRVLYGMRIEIRSLNIVKKRKKIKIKFRLRGRRWGDWRTELIAIHDGVARVRHANYFWHKRAWVFLNVNIYTSATVVEPDARKGLSPWLYRHNLFFSFSFSFSICLTPSRCRVIGYAFTGNCKTSRLIKARESRVRYQFRDRGHATMNALTGKSQRMRKVSSCLLYRFLRDAFQILLIFSSRLWRRDVKKYARLLPPAHF